MPAPSLHAVRGGFEARCGGCLATSPTVEASTAEEAWPKLVAMGWTQREGRTYALCPGCTAEPPNPDKDAAKARKARRWK